jgi:hypothetical protein
MRNVQATLKDDFIYDSNKQASASMVLGEGRAVTWHNRQERFLSPFLLSIMCFDRGIRF